MLSEDWRNGHEAGKIIPLRMTRREKSTEDNRSKRETILVRTKRDRARTTEDRSLGLLRMPEDSINPL
jgi:hypothetical protein